MFSSNPTVSLGKQERKLKVFIIFVIIFTKTEQKSH